MNRLALLSRSTVLAFAPRAYVRKNATAAAAPASEAAATPANYSRPMQIFHWFMGIGMCGAIGLVVAAQQLPGKKNGDPVNDAKVARRGELMKFHKSIGLAMFAAMVPRVGLRLVSKIPAPLPGAPWEHLAGTLSHALLYGAIVFMPASGVIFGYYGGYGVPFFDIWKLQGATPEKKNKEIADFFFTWHTRVGEALEYLLVAHVGAVFYHILIKKQAILARMYKGNK